MMNKTTIYDFGFAIGDAKENKYASMNAARMRWLHSMHRFRQAADASINSKQARWKSAKTADDKTASNGMAASF